MEPPTNGAEKTQDADDSDTGSGVGLNFIPVDEDDLSTLGFSIGPAAQDPDGYKSDDNNYRNRIPREYPPIKTGERDDIVGCKSQKRNESIKQEMMLPSVEEWSVDESGADARPSTKVNKSSMAAKEKIDAIMKRGSKNEPKPNATDPSFHEDDVSKVHLIASKYRHAEEDDSLSTPQTTPGLCNHGCFFHDGMLRTY